MIFTFHAACNRCCKGSAQSSDWCCRHRLLQRARRRLIDKVPSTWEEKELDVVKWRLDKAFACVSAMPAGDDTMHAPPATA
jgi:hypothetical protein